MFMLSHPGRVQVYTESDALTKVCAASPLSYSGDKQPPVASSLAQATAMNLLMGKVCKHDPLLSALCSG